MNQGMYRKVALERLSSPDQLDLLMEVTSPRGWIGLLGVMLVLGILIAWGYLGLIATTAVGQGILVRTGGVFNVTATGSGVVQTVTLKAGDRVRAHQVVALIAQPVLAARIHDAEQKIAEGRLLRETAQARRSGGVKLQLEALNRQRENSKRQIGVLAEQLRIVVDQVAADDQLFAKGLITRQQTLASRQRNVEIEDRMAAEKALLKQYDAQQFTIEAQPRDADEEAGLRLEELARELTFLRQDLKREENVVAPYGGQVLEVKVLPGTAVAAGAAILSIQPESDSLEVVLYVSSHEAKSVNAGMSAQISPSTVRREESGYLKATIAWVADYPSTPEALMRNFQNSSLADLLAHSGPVTEVRARLIPDIHSQSGFAWSSPSGPAVKLSAGTLCSIRIVTREQRPVTLVLPWMKENLGI